MLIQNLYSEGVRSKHSKINIKDAVAADVWSKKARAIARGEFVLTLRPEKGSAPTVLCTLLRWKYPLRRNTTGWEVKSLVWRRAI